MQSSHRWRPHRLRRNGLWTVVQQQGAAAALVYQIPRSWRLSRNRYSSGVSPLVYAGEAPIPEEKLAEAVLGTDFLLQGADCAESFEEFRIDNIRDTFCVLQMGVVLIFGGQMLVVEIALTFVVLLLLTVSRVLSRSVSVCAPRYINPVKLSALQNRDLHGFVCFTTDSHIANWCSGRGAEIPQLFN